MGSSQNGICIKSSTAHLICLGNSRLSTEVTLFEIPIGNITIGNNDNCDIVLKGSGIQDVHCRCSRRSGCEEEEGDVTLSPIGSAKVSVEGVPITDDYVLQQGDTITLGDSIFLRFNFPAKAILLKNSAAAMESSKRSINDNYEVLKKNLNTSCVNFTEFSNNSDKTLNNNVKITEKMKNLKMKANDSYPKISNLQVFPSASKSIENCANVSISSNNNGSIMTAATTTSATTNGNNLGENDAEMQQLEDVLKMFVEYNNSNGAGCESNSNQSSKNNINNLQTSSDKINVTHQNRIKTNGSLPKNFHTKDHAHNFDFFEQSDSKTTDDIENYKKPTSPRSPRSPRTRIKTFVSSPTTKSLSPTDNNDKSYECDKNGTTTTTSSTSFESKNNEKDYEKLIKSFEEKFRMDIYNIQNCENLTHVRSTDSSNRSLHSSNLNSEKNEILTKIRELKILISDVQYQESESVLDSDVEKSLVSAEMSDEKSNLEILNEKLSAIKGKMKQLEIERMKRQKQQEIQQIKLKNVIQDKEAEIKMLQEQREVSVGTETRLEELQKSLDMDIKTFEDFEFHYLEEETEWASLLEEYREDINTFTRQIEEKKNYIYQLEQTKRENENSTQSEQKTLEKKLFNLKQKLENEREKLKSIDKLLSMKRSSIEEGGGHSSKTISNSSAYNGDDTNSISTSSQINQSTALAIGTSAASATTTDIMSKSFNENMFYNRSRIEVSYFDFSLTAESLPRNSKTASPQTAPVAAAGAINSIRRINESGDSNNASPLMMPKYHSLSSINYSNDNLLNQKMSDNHNSSNSFRNSNSIANGAATSSSSASSSPLSTKLPVVQHRQAVAKQKRPLTRYLPNFSLDFNLRTHIETAGHQIQLCPHVIIDATSCRGYLNKVGTKPLFSNLRDLKRWFVFDREKQMFVYYSNKSEKKPRGGAYFSAICDVYFDHSALDRTFIVKTKSRTFTLQAPSSQACSIWIDVIITGAQAKIFEYEK